MAEYYKQLFKDYWVKFTTKASTWNNMTMSEKTTQQANWLRTNKIEAHELLDFITAQALC